MCIYMIIFFYIDEFVNYAAYLFIYEYFIKYLTIRSEDQN